MPIIMELAAKIGLFFTDMLDNIRMIYAEKGIEPFKKPLLFSLPTLLILYAAFYTPLGAKVKSRSAELANREVIASHSADYEDAKTRLSGYQRRLPLIKDKEEWLNYLMTSTAKTYDISFDSLSAQTESEVGSFLLVSREVTVTTTYANFGKWIAELERSPIIIKVAEANIRKDTTRPGSVKVNMKLSTIFPRFGGAGGGK